MRSSLTCKSRSRDATKSESSKNRTVPINLRAAKRQQKNSLKRQCPSWRSMDFFLQIFGNVRLQLCTTSWRDEACLLSSELARWIIHLHTLRSRKHTRRGHFWFHDTRSALGFSTTCTMLVADSTDNFSNWSGSGESGKNQACSRKLMVGWFFFFFATRVCLFNFQTCGCRCTTCNWPLSCTSAWHHNWHKLKMILQSAAEKILMCRRKWPWPSSNVQLFFFQLSKHEHSTMVTGNKWLSSDEEDWTYIFWKERRIACSLSVSACSACALQQGNKSCTLKSVDRGRSSDMRPSKSTPECTLGPCLIQSVSYN